MRSASSASASASVLGGASGSLGKGAVGARDAQAASARRVEPRTRRMASALLLAGGVLASDVRLRLGVGLLLVLLLRFLLLVLVLRLRRFVAHASIRHPTWITRAGFEAGGPRISGQFGGAYIGSPLAGSPC